MQTRGVALTAWLGVLAATCTATAQQGRSDRESMRGYAKTAQAVVQRRPDYARMTPGQRNLLVSQLVAGLASGKVRPKDLEGPGRELQPQIQPLLVLPEAAQVPFPFNDAVFNDNFQRNMAKVGQPDWCAWVWGGTSACVNPEEFPECVQVIAHVGGASSTSPGSGVVVGRRAVLAAAHTVAGATQIEVVLACTAGNGKPCQVATPVVVAPARPPGSNPWDLVILVLPETLPDGVIMPTPPTLATTGQIDSCDVPAVTAVGYGADDQFGAGGIGTRRVARGMIALCKNCTPVTPCPDPKPPQDPCAEYGCLPGMELVAAAARADQTRVDTCEGDSGGPMYFQDSTGKYILAGVVRAAVKNSAAECGSGGRYTRIDDAEVLAWIKSYEKK